MDENYIKPSKEELQEVLDEMAYKVTQEDATEAPGSSPLDKEFGPGIYVDILTGSPLYSSKDKYDAGCGWPSFSQTIKDSVIKEREDHKLGMIRTEVRSASSDNHLGHVFNDGPKEAGGLRYCINGAALRFVPRDKMEAEGYGEYLQYV